jgi:hypothetical protein
VLAIKASTWTRNIVTSAWTMDNQYNIVSTANDGILISIHEQSECYTCKQYECNEYVRSALARSNTIKYMIRAKFRPDQSKKYTAVGPKPTTFSKKANLKAIFFPKKANLKAIFFPKKATIY